MKLLLKVGIAGMIVVGLCCSTVSAQNRTGRPADKPAAGDTGNKKPSDSTSPSTTRPSEPPASKETSRDPVPEEPVIIERPTAPDRATTVADQVDAIKTVIDDFNQAKTDFLQKEEELRRELTAQKTEEARAIIRAQIRQTRVNFLAAQSDAREEMMQLIKERTTDQLREQLPDHREVMDAAREQTRERVREQRKGGVD